MNSLWNDNEAKKYADHDLQLRVYTSQLLGKESSLVLHGGGNTSVKIEAKNIFGENEALLYVKGSGWDLATIPVTGFVPVKLDLLKKLVQLEQLSDIEMVRMQRAAMLDSSMPSPSVEAILHAIIPYRFVDHTHADAVVTLSNTKKSIEIIREIYGSQILIIPYVMPGFILAKKVYETTKTMDWKKIEGMILLNHGVFSFADNAKSSYERMIQIVSQAENYLKKHARISPPTAKKTTENLLHLARIRRAVSRIKGSPVIVKTVTDTEALDFSSQPQSLALASRGPLTPDHVIRTKPFPVQISENPENDISQYARAYQDYFHRNANEQLLCLNPAPCWAIWPHHGILSFGSTYHETMIIADINAHTIQAIKLAESLGGWKPLPEKDIFNLEYWELEQAKLKRSAKNAEFQGKVVLVTGAASGIGQACVQAFHAQGACVAALDINPEISGLFNQSDIFELVCDVTDRQQVEKSIHAVIRHFGGLDILVSNAGIFPPSEPIANMTPDNWEQSLKINLSSHQSLMQTCIPYLSLGIEPAIVIIASKNVPAPGPGVSAYSVAKAGLTQLARVAALELSSLGIRVNVLHPNAVFDTKLWAPEVLQQRAAHYEMSVNEYKTNNLLQVEITSADVARLACVIAGPAFAKTTGAQIPIDGGNNRVI